jgi:hypothetical protein
MDEMEWTPATPPRLFDCYGQDYIPGGWPIDPPTPTANVFARPAEPGFFLPAAKRICRSIAWAFNITVAEPSHMITRRVRASRRESRRTAQLARPLPHLRESPFQRAIRYKERNSYNTIVTTPNPFREVPEQTVAGPSTRPPPPAAAPAPRRSAIAGFRRPRRQVHFTPQSNPTVQPRSELFYGMPVFAPPKEATPRVMSPHPDPETPPSCGHPFLDPKRFPSLLPEGVQIRTGLPTPPPESPSTQLMADLDNANYNIDDGTSDASSDLSDSWLPMDMPAQKKQHSKRRDQKRVTIMPTGEPVMKQETGNGAMMAPETATDMQVASSVQNAPVLSIKNETVSIANDAPEATVKEEAADDVPKAKSAIVMTQPQSDIKTEQYTTLEIENLAAATPSKSTSSNAILQTPQSAESELSSTVPDFPDDEMSLNLSDLIKPRTPTPTKTSPKLVTPDKTSPKPSTPRALGSSPPVDFDKLHISSRPVTPEKQIFSTPKAERHSGEKTARKTRAQQAREEWEKGANQYKTLAPLNAGWETRVKQAVQNGHGKLSASDFARVVPFRTSYGTDNWLNDEVINEYLNLIVAHGKSQDREGQVPSHHTFNSFFYNKLVKDGPESVKRWGTRGKIGGKALLQTKYVFVPINAGAHWTLAVVSGEQKTITYYNSLPGSGRAKLETLKKWVQNELGSAFKEEEWTLSEGESPMQGNSDDCGVFTITSARQIMLGFTPMSYEPADIEVQRKRIVAELVNGGLLKAAE